MKLVRKFQISNFKFQIVLASSFLFLASVSQALAATTPTPTCQPIYGGGTYNCNGAKITVDKTVQDVQSGVFVQNLGVNDAHYSPQATVPFRIVIKNTGTTAIKNITIKDTFPKYLTYTSGEGKYDTNAKALTITLATLDAGKSKQYDIKAKVATVQELPQDQSVTCVTNQVSLKSNDVTLADSTQVCLQRQTVTTTGSSNTTKGNTTLPTPTTPAISKGGQIVYPVTTNQNITKTPSTGPDALALFALAPASLLGSFLRRKAGK